MKRRKKTSTRKEKVKRHVRVVKRKIQFFKLTLAIRNFFLKLMRDMVLEAFSDMLFDEVIDRLGDFLFNYKRTLVEQVELYVSRA